MNPKIIHCPICNGTGRLFDKTHGNIACLNCKATGIVELNEEQQGIIRKKEIEIAREEAEIREVNRKKIVIEEEQKRENEKNMKIEARKLEEKKIKKADESYRNTIIAIVIIGAVIMLGVYNWDAILKTFKDTLMGILSFILVIAILSVILGGS